jgi:hypothetical protein
VSETPPRMIDGENIVCSFHTWDCSDKAAFAGGFDQHHAWPVSMGGPETPEDLLVLCATHHRRQHALIRTYIEYGPSVRTVKWFSKLERDTARYAYDRWVGVGRPKVYFNVPAAKVAI